jgi:hypothetical protein
MHVQVNGNDTDITGNTPASQLLVEQDVEMPEVVEFA